MRAWYLIFDAVAVVLFVVIGRDTHDEANTLGAILETAGPFLIALGVGWLISRAWATPGALSTGGYVATITLVLGVALRRWLFEAGTATAFVIVTAGFLAFTMLGWRVIALLLARRRGPTA